MGNIEAAKPSSGLINCTADDETGLRLYFTYAKKRPSEQVDVHLTGCEGVGAPGRESIDVNSDFYAALTPLAPAAWRRVLR